MLFIDGDIIGKIDFVGNDDDEEVENDSDGDEEFSEVAGTEECNETELLFSFESKSELGDLDDLGVLSILSLLLIICSISDLLEISLEDISTVEDELRTS